MVEGFCSRERRHDECFGFESISFSFRARQKRKLERGYVDARDEPPTASQDCAPHRPGTLSGEGLLRRERALVFHVFICMSGGLLALYFLDCHRSRLS